MAISVDGGAVSFPANLGVVLPPLGLQASDGTLLLQWSGDGILQTATNVTGPFADVPALQNSFSNAMEAPQQFFRLRK